MSNTITAYFKGRVGVAESVYQNDYGIVMAFDSIELPAHFDCYFSRLNQEEALPGVGADNRVVIPNSILADPGNMTIHIPMHTGSSDSEVEYVVYFKVVGRARPIDDGTPTQMTAVERALALLSQPITNIEEIVNEALDFTGDTFAEMKAELMEDYNDFAQDVNGDISEFKSEIREDISDVEGDFAILQSGFDSAIAAVTTDTEVTNIRVGVDNVTYPTAGEAVRTQIGKLASLSKNIYNPENEVANSVYESDGSIVGHLSYKINTDYIPVQYGDYVSFYGNSSTLKDGVQNYCLYDANKDFIKRDNFENLGLVTKQIDGVGAMYMRVSLGINATDVMMVIDKSQPSYSELNYTPFGALIRYDALPAELTEKVDKVEAISGIASWSRNIYDASKEQENSVLESDGTIVYHADFKANPEYIPIEYGDYVSFYANDSTKHDGVQNFCLYDENKTHIKRDNFTNMGLVTKQVDGVGAKYIRFSVGKYAQDVMIVVDKTQPTYTKLDYEPYGARIHEDALPIALLDRIDTLEDNTILSDIFENEIKETVGTNAQYDGKLNFIWQSDQHLSADTLNDYRQFRIISKIAKANMFDFICLGGDIIDGSPNANSHKDVVIEYMREVATITGGCDPDVYLLKGNHETNFNAYNIYFPDDEFECISNQEIYRLFFNRLDGNVVFNELEDYPTYFYKDFPRSKVRVICLNTSDNMGDDGTVYGDPAYSYLRQKQFTWFCEKALNFTDKEDASEWAVLTLGHVSIISAEAFCVGNDTTIFKGVLNAFQSGSAYEGSSDVGEWYELSADVDFSSQGAIEYIGHVQGHGHLDGLVITYGMDVPNIYVANSYSWQTSAGALADYGFTSYPRVRNEITSQLFDLINIDRSSHTINLTRYGAGIDRIVHYKAQAISSSVTLTSKLSGTLTWISTDTDIATVSNGVVSIVEEGYDPEYCTVCIYAKDVSGNKEYWIFNVVLE